MSWSYGKGDLLAPEMSQGDQAEEEVQSRVPRGMSLESTRGRERQ